MKNTIVVIMVVFAVNVAACDLFNAEEETAKASTTVEEETVEPIKFESLEWHYNPPASIKNCFPAGSGFSNEPLPELSEDDPVLLEEHHEGITVSCCLAVLDWHDNHFYDRDDERRERYMHEPIYWHACEAVLFKSGTLTRHDKDFDFIH